MSNRFNMKIGFCWRLKAKLRDRRHERRMKRQRYKRGWADDDAWSVDIWFIRTATPILERYRDNLQGWDNSRFATFEENKAAVSRLVGLLYKMRDPVLMDGKPESPEEAKERVEAKDEFFKLFSEMFYGLWD